MHKVGPRYGATPDAIFNFSLLGTTLAKITVSGTPDQWGIELIPWSSVYDPNSWNGGMVKSGDYLYTFMGREQKKAFLTRLPLDDLENPQEHIEYFAKDGKWKPGVDPDEACGLILITYDCNAANFTKLVSNMKLYSPRVLSIRFPKWTH